MVRREGSMAKLGGDTPPPRRFSARLAASDANSPSINPPLSANHVPIDVSSTEARVEGIPSAFAKPASIATPAQSNRAAYVAIPLRAIEQRTTAPNLPSHTSLLAAPLSINPAGLRSSSESSKSGPGDPTSGYNTPCTSTVPTPVEGALQATWTLSVVPRTRQPRVNASVRAQELRESRYALAPKRKRTPDIESYDGDGVDDVANSVDAQIARALQRQEAALSVGKGQVSPTSGLRAKRFKSEVGDSDDPDDDLEAASAPAKSARSLRSRLSRTRAQTSAKTLIKAPMMDAGGTESDSSDLSSLHSDLYGTEASIEESEDDSDDEMTQAQSMAPTIAPAATAAVPAAATATAVAVPGSTAVTVSTQAPLPQRPRARGRRRIAAERRATSMREKLQKHHPEIKWMWEDLEAVPLIAKAQASQPPSITCQLKPFQREGLNWMIQQEKTKWKGGLLGDEMGMGKTIQAVSLIMSDYPAENPSLVLVPPVAMMQWQKEIQDYTSGTLKVLLYHGAAMKKVSVKQLKEYNVVITSYSTLEATYRKQERGWTRKDKEEDGMVIVREDSPFHIIKFHRVILDEAHCIKSRATGTAKACFGLQANFRWCLSGTPLQNRIGELLSLLRFLRVVPFASYMCKSCDCSEIQWTINSKTQKCNVCSHQSFDHVSLFNLEVLNPILDQCHPEFADRAFQKLQLLMARIMLRRVKADYMSSMELPSKDVGLHAEFFGNVERDLASSIMTNTTRQFDTYVAQGVMLNNYANIFGLIMRMRQVADHPDLILRKDVEGGQNILVCCICDDPAEDAIRSACRHDFCRSCVKSYIKSFSQRDAEPGCPRCHIALSIDMEQDEIEQNTLEMKKTSIINRIRMEKWTSSTKIEMLVMELRHMRSSKRTTKCIIFSQFTSMLQLVEWRLRRAGFNTVMLDGTMTPVQRQSSIDYFMKTFDVEVFLVSLKAGGIALNLTEASRVYIIDPWWNPAAEWQSADRCHRIGQGRPCTVTRLVIEDSVESRMVLLQEKKTNMIHGTINADERAMQNLSPEDMQFLFRGS